MTDSAIKNHNFVFLFDVFCCFFFLAFFSSFLPFLIAFLPFLIPLSLPSFFPSLILRFLPFYLSSFFFIFFPPSPFLFSFPTTRAHNVFPPQAQPLEQIILCFRKTNYVTYFNNMFASFVIRYKNTFHKSLTILFKTAQL